MISHRKSMSQQHDTNKSVLLESIQGLSRIATHLCILNAPSLFQLSRQKFDSSYCDTSQGH